MDSLFPTADREASRGAKKMDLQGIEPWTTPMLREYYTTKPQARGVGCELTDGVLDDRYHPIVENNSETMRNQEHYRL
jgi:hypothetical protein